jgi:hypothetical protein
MELSPPCECGVEKLLCQAQRAKPGASDGSDPQPAPFRPEHTVQMMFCVVSHQRAIRGISMKDIIDMGWGFAVALQNVTRKAMHARRFWRDVTALIQQPTERLPIRFPSVHLLRSNSDNEDRRSKTRRLCTKDNPLI